jgi:hypothetical protein
MNEEKEFFAISAIPYCLLVLLALASAVHADTGQYNYNITLLNSTGNYSIGTDMIINAYVAYQGSAIKEQPCTITFYDYTDQNKLFSARLYTDELGQLFYKAPVSDIFMNNQTYNYDVQCSNTTVTGSILVTTNTRHTLIDNILAWLKQNIDFMIVVGIVLFLASILFFAKQRK